MHAYIKFRCKNLYNRRERERERPSHLRFSAADPILELIVEIGAPIEGLGGGRRAPDIEVRESVVVGLAVQMLGLQYDAVAVEYQRLECTRRS